MTNEHWAPAAKYMFAIGTLFTLATALSTAFLNVFFWKEHKSLSAIALYNGMQFVMIPILFSICRKLPWKHSELYIRAGIFFYGISYGLLLFLKSYANPYVLGITFGIGAGFYWFAYNLLSFRVLQEHQRASFNGYIGVFNSLSNVAAPLVSGIIITNTAGNLGYFLIFGLSVSLFLIAFLLSFRLHAKPYDIPTAPLFRRQHPNWNKILVGNVLQGMKEGVFSYLPAILVYITTQSEMSLGKYSAITAFISSISFFIMGKYLSKRWFNECMIVGSMLSTAAIAVFMIRLNFTMVMLYGLITAISVPVFSVPFLTRVLHVIDEAHEIHQQEYLVEREICLNTGRVLSVGSFLLGYDVFPKEWIPIYLLTLGVMQVIAVFIFRSVKINTTFFAHETIEKNDRHTHFIRQKRKRLLKNK
ncbi:MFS transporter [Fodinisporobacter ferrooxydans]|uniref:MFS transporter n=1 Tax=Fodinisporobacter ferrooxydans TaxID=2901836 RepID=A0ABY4CHP1_9BACL|nr:MFS transporter [Alicyclobacillaceae bacterium MYW30-H2]